MHFCYAYSSPDATNTVHMTKPEKTEGDIVIILYFTDVNFILYKTVTRFANAEETES